MKVPAYVSDGSRIDLADFRADQVDIREMAAALSRIARYSGMARGAAFSVAQHSVFGARALIEEGRDPITAAGFLLHDGHEYLFGDWPSPAVDLVRLHLSGIIGPAGGRALKLAIAAAKASIDTAIFAAAGLPSPADWPKAQWKIVEQMDRRMRQAESLHLFGDQPDRRIPLPKLRGAIKPWPAMKAEEEFMKTYCQLIGDPPPRRRGL